jgi:hypothetical protein
LIAGGAVASTLPSAVLGFGHNAFDGVAPANRSEGELRGWSALKPRSLLMSSSDAIADK